MPSNAEPASRTGSAWYRQPVLWLGIAIFAASLAGCVWLIVVSVRHADTPLTTAHEVFGVPVSAHHGTPPASPRSSP